MAQYLVVDMHDARRDLRPAIAAQRFGRVLKGSPGPRRPEILEQPRRGQGIVEMQERADAQLLAGPAMRRNVAGGGIEAGGNRLDQRYAEPFIGARSEEHTSELQSLMRISYAVFCLKKTKDTSY